MINEFNIETTVNLVSIETLNSGNIQDKIYRVKSGSYALIISNNSELSFFVNSSAKHLDTQSVFLCMPDDLVRFTNDTPPLGDCYIINFSYNGSSSLFRKTSVQIPVTGTISDPLFYGIISAMLKERAYDVYNYKPRQNILLAYLLLLLCRYHKNNVVESQITDSESLPQYVKVVLDYLECSYQNDISSLDIQRAVGMNYDYINTLFKKYVGMTIMKYLDNMRINSACELLQHTFFPVSEISRRVGISSPQYFTRKFSAIVGMSPQKYRETIKESL